MNILELILIIIGLVLILVSAFPAVPTRVNLLALGLFFAILGFAVPVFTAA